jgi:hypothetical protein
MSRATRLAEIKAKLVADLGYNADTLDGADKERIEHAALLKLQYEITAARLVEGSGVATDELVRLTEAVNAMLPVKAPKPLVIRYVDSDGAGNVGHGGEEQRLQREVDEWRAKYFELIKKGGAAPPPPEPQAVENIGSDVLRSPATEPSNVVPFVGNGSCAIDAPLEQRYPHLRDTPPVGRW